MKRPKVGLILHPQFSPFHFSVPFMVFSITLPDGPLFDLVIVTPDGKPLESERSMTVQPDGGLELLDTVDIAIVPGWHDLNEAPPPELTEALIGCHQRVRIWWDFVTELMHLPMRVYWTTNRLPPTGWQNKIFWSDSHRYIWTPTRSMSRTIS